MSFLHNRGKLSLYLCCIVTLKTRVDDAAVTVSEKGFGGGDSSVKDFHPFNYTDWGKWEVSGKCRERKTQGKLLRLFSLGNNSIPWSMQLSEVFKREKETLGRKDDGKNREKMMFVSLGDRNRAISLMPRLIKSVTLYREYVCRTWHRKMETGN